MYEWKYAFAGVYCLNGSVFRRYVDGQKISCLQMIRCRSDMFSMKIGPTFVGILKEISARWSGITGNRFFHQLTVGVRDIHVSGYCPRMNRASSSAIPSCVHVGRPWLHWLARSVFSMSRNRAFISGMVRLRLARTAW